MTSPTPAREPSAEAKELRRALKCLRLEVDESIAADVERIAWDAVNEARLAAYERAARAVEGFDSFRANQPGWNVAVVAAIRKLAAEEIA